ncbi:Lrp/AsnC family transcriptional regulator [Microbacterium sp. bgisy207]|uniref:Lrp/AsnC family transcriptional regulator n=1 Tax=Microbacterium sp. bgisy207 TaxID=3413800 RepID=UPI003EBABBB4
MTTDALTPRLDDDMDARILRALSTNARATLADLSAAVGLSVSAVQARVRRLESRGIITGYRVVVDPEAVGKPLAAFVEITPLDPAQPDTAPEMLAHLEEIEACHSIAGAASYLLLVRVATPRHLEALLRDIRAAAGVSTRTTIVLQTFYENRTVAPASVPPRS